MLIIIWFSHCLGSNTHKEYLINTIYPNLEPEVEVKFLSTIFLLILYDAEEIIMSDFMIKLKKKPSLEKTELFKSCITPFITKLYLINRLISSETILKFGKFLKEKILHLIKDQTYIEMKDYFNLPSETQICDELYCLHYILNIGRFINRICIFSLSEKEKFVAEYQKFIANLENTSTNNENTNLKRQRVILTCPTNSIMDIKQALCEVLNQDFPCLIFFETNFEHFLLNDFIKLHKKSTSCENKDIIENQLKGMLTDLKKRQIKASEIPQKRKEPNEIIFFDLFPNLSRNFLVVGKPNLKKLSVLRAYFDINYTHLPIEYQDTMCCLFVKMCLLNKEVVSQNIYRIISELLENKKFRNIKIYRK